MLLITDHEKESFSYVAAWKQPLNPKFFVDKRALKMQTFAPLHTVHKYFRSTS